MLRVIHVRNFGLHVKIFSGSLYIYNSNLCFLCILFAVRLPARPIEPKSPILTGSREYVPVSSGRGGSGGIAAEKWFVGKIARKWLLNNDATMTSPVIVASC